MFNKTADQTGALARASNTKSIFASDLKITGEVTSTGDIDMMGEVEGNITARAISVGAEGRMSGALRAETVEIKGRLDGQVEAGNFTLRSSAKVAADVAYQTLVIESGAEIDGRFSRRKG
jgi:cytoskeletal protein CcmA (bactofilin family)